MLDRLAPPPGATKKRKRVGRGEGSGHGKTSGRGHKGQRSRSGSKLHAGFEGGQMPLQRRLPKRGFKNIFRKEYLIVNLKTLSVFPAGTLVDEALLREKGFIKGACDGVKILGNGELSAALTVRAHKFSEAAQQKIEKAGGKAEVI